MMLNLKLFLTLSALGALLQLRPYTTHAASIKQTTKTPWELFEALYAGGQIRGFNGTWITDEEFYYTADDRSIRKYNAATNTDSEFVSKTFLDIYRGSTFTLSPDNTKILVRYAVESEAHSSIAKYDIYDIEKGTSTSIRNSTKLQYCAWSSVQDRLSYVYNNNVHIRYETGQESTLTSEGVNGIISNGMPDWVYAEEVLSSASAMWWSPDGSKLAVGFFDDTKVQTFKYFLYSDAEDVAFQYPKEVDLKYPKAGTPNPVVAVKIFDLNSVVPSSVTIKAPAAVVSKDHILQNVAWAGTDSVLITWLNRRQNISSIQACTVAGACREVTRLKESMGWIEIGIPTCLKNGENCLFTNWIDNWYQVWNLNLKTGENVWKSRGNFTILKVYGYDEAQNKLYYQATAQGDPSIYHVYSNNDCFSCNLRDMDGALCTTAEASFSKNFSYYTVTCNGPNPAYTKIFKTKTNTEIKTWESNSAFRQILETKLRPIIKYLNVTLADGSIGFAKLELPPNLDENKKYPMIVDVYGGPNSMQVSRNFKIDYSGYMTTMREVIYASIDGRGTGNKGKDLLFSVNNNLGVHEVEDQIAVTKSLQKMLPYIDGHRIGIWGWSYGGYMTARTLGHDTEQVFQCGISVAPVTSWLFYDTIYTERYMGLPTAEDNLKHYLDSSVFGNVENFRHHNFLLIHGSADDNVHYQQSLMLAKSLQQQDIMFEEMFYTDEDHGIWNFDTHLYRTMDQFWVNCLNL